MASKSKRLEAAKAKLATVVADPEREDAAAAVVEVEVVDPEFNKVDTVPFPVVIIEDNTVMPTDDEMNGIVDEAAPLIDNTDDIEVVTELQPSEAEAAAAMLAAEPTPVVAPAPVAAPPVVQAAVPDVVIGRRHRYDTSHHIVVLAERNPKKLGTAGYDRFAVYHTGMTVKQYMEHKAVGKFAAADLRWDLDRKFIKVVSATEINQYMSIELPMAAE